MSSGHLQLCEQQGFGFLHSAWTLITYGAAQGNWPTAKPHLSSAHPPAFTYCFWKDRRKYLKMGEHRRKGLAEVRGERAGARWEPCSKRNLPQGWKAWGYMCVFPGGRHISVPSGASSLQELSSQLFSPQDSLHPIIHPVTVLTVPCLK